MSKNIVFIPWIKDESRATRSLPYKYSIASWKQWCEKNDCDLVVMDEPICPVSEMKITWQRYYALDILDNSGIDYDQVLMVDADTIIHPDTPNFFKMTDGKLCGVEFDGSWDWVLRSVENYSKHIFEDYMMDWWRYFDCGFIVVNQNHKELFKSITDFYHNNSQNLIQMQNTYHGGTDQTPVNMLINKLGIDFKLLPYEFNMNDMNRKELYGDDLLFTKVGWIYQYNAIPNNKDNQLTNHFMKKTYEHFYGELND